VPSEARSAKEGCINPDRPSSSLRIFSAQPAGRFASLMSRTVLAYAGALRLPADKLPQPKPTLRRPHSKPEATPNRAQLRQATAHRPAQTLAPHHLSRLLRQTKASQIRALSEIRLRPRLRESTSVVEGPTLAMRSLRFVNYS